MKEKARPAKFLRLQRVPKRVQKLAWLKRRISICPEQARSIIDSDQLNLFQVCNDCKKNT
jgi:hypothetical protein